MKPMSFLVLSALSLAILIAPEARVVAADQGPIPDNICRYDSQGGGEEMPNCLTASMPCGDTRNAATNMLGLRLNKGAGRTPVDAHGICRYLNSASDNSYFVPFRTDREWFAFLMHKPAGVVEGHCARPHTTVDPYSGIDDERKLYFGPSGKKEDMGDTGDNNRKPVSLPYFWTDLTWPPQQACATEEFHHKCYEEYAEEKCFRWDTCSRCTATDKDGKCTSIETYACCGDTGSVCKKREYSWTEKYAFSATAGDSDVLEAATVPQERRVSWLNGKSTLLSGARPMQCDTRCTDNGHDCTCKNGPEDPDTNYNGVCGSANGKALTSAPSGGELCATGKATGVGGTGPWSWMCLGYNGAGLNGNNQSCSSQATDSTCPPVSVYGPPSMLGPLANPLGAGYVDIRVVGYADGRVTATQQTDNGGVMQWTGWGTVGCNYYDSWDLNVLVQCIVTNYVKSLPAFSSMVGECPVSGGYISPLKVNLAGKDAEMNKTRPTSFYLTLKDERVMKGLATGGLNADEGWLMVHRDGGPLVFRDGALNADNWFGDRDGRTRNGYTDLAETFSKFVKADEEGKRFIPLRALTKEERTGRAPSQLKDPAKAAADPSYALRVLDARNVERFASDYFTRIYVDYRMVNEGDGPKGKPVNNVILERGIVKTVKGENRAAVDQWFILDLPAGLGPTKQETKSKVLPKGSKPKQ